MINPLKIVHSFNLHPIPQFYQSTCSQPDTRSDTPFRARVYPHHQEELRQAPTTLYALSSGDQGFEDWVCLKSRPPNTQIWAAKHSPSEWTQNDTSQNDSQPPLTPSLDTNSVLRSIPDNILREREVSAFTNTT